MFKVFIANFIHISHLVLVFLLLTINMYLLAWFTVVAMLRILDVGGFWLHLLVPSHGKADKFLLFLY